MRTGIAWASTFLVRDLATSFGGCEPSDTEREAATRP